MSAKRPDSDIFGEVKDTAPFKRAGSDYRPKDAQLFTPDDGRSKPMRTNTTGKNINDTTLSLGGDYPEPPAVTDKVK